MDIVIIKCNSLGPQCGLIFIEEKNHHSEIRRRRWKLSNTHYIVVFYVVLIFGYLDHPYFHF